MKVRYSLDIGNTFRIDDMYEYTKDLWYVSLTSLDINEPSSGIETKLYDYLAKNEFDKDEPLFVLCTFLEGEGESLTKQTGLSSNGKMSSICWISTLASPPIDSFVIVK